MVIHLYSKISYACVKDDLARLKFMVKASIWYSGQRSRLNRGHEWTLQIVSWWYTQISCGPNTTPCHKPYKFALLVKGQRRIYQNHECEIWYVTYFFDKSKVDKYAARCSQKNFSPQFCFLSNVVVGSRTHIYLECRIHERVILYIYWLHERVTWEIVTPRKPLLTEAKPKMTLIFEGWQFPMLPSHPRYKNATEC